MFDSLPYNNRGDINNKQNIIIVKNMFQELEKLHILILSQKVTNSNKNY